MSIRAYPGAKNPTHEISLTDGVETWGLRLDGGPRAIQEIPLTPSTLRISGGDSKFGDWEPGMAQIEQRTWEGGRGLEDFADDPTRFYDSMNAWTMTPGRIMPAPQWRFAQGLRDADGYLPGNIGWVALSGDRQYMARSFTADPLNGVSYVADKAYLWVRRVGSPGGSLVVELWTDAGDLPDGIRRQAKGHIGRIVKGQEYNAQANGDAPSKVPLPEESAAIAEVDTQAITDVVSVFHGFDWDRPVTLDDGTIYWLVVYDDGTPNRANHWEVGVTNKGDGIPLKSTDGNIWSSADEKIHFRVVDADQRRKFKMFTFRGALYSIEQPEGRGKSRLYLNGDRGAAEKSPKFKIRTLYDSDKTWEANAWKGAFIRIVDGRGAGQARRIVRNTANYLEVTPNWDIPLAGNSDYVIYATDRWTDISPTSGDKFDTRVTGVAVADAVVYFARGMNAPILKMRFNSGAHEFADDTEMADLLYLFNNPTEGPQLFRANSNNVTVARSKPKDWGSDLAFKAEVDVGDDHYGITNLVDYNDQLWIMKEDSLWTLSKDLPVKLNVGLEAMPESANGAAVAAQGLFLYLSWSHSLQRLYGGSLDDVGPWQGAGLPRGRQGVVSSLTPAISWLIAGIDAGEGTSSVLVWDGRGWHEIFRAWEPGQRVRGVFWQACPGTRPRLWVDVGGELVYLEFPHNTLNPSKDHGFKFQHEAVVELAAVDLGAARLPKFIKEMTLITERLNRSNEVHLEYQLDNQVGSNQWVSAEAFHRAPQEALPINQGDVRRIRPRLRLLTSWVRRPPLVVATVIEGYARTPLKYQWNMRLKVSDLQSSDGRSAGDFVDWLKGAAQSARKIRMNAIWEGMDDTLVIVEPPTLLRQFTNTLLNWWGGVVTISLREV